MGILMIAFIVVAGFAFAYGLSNFCARRFCSHRDKLVPHPLKRQAHTGSHSPRRSA